MLLGKRPCPSIKRTTSMTGFTVDITKVESSDPSDPHHHHHASPDPEGPSPAVVAAHHLMNFGRNDYDHQRFLTAMVSPINNNNYQQQQQKKIYSSSSVIRSSGEFLETAHFLKTCGLCKRQLAPGKDIYMYRGDTAFCSFECREHQMKQDERKEKFASKKKEESLKNNAAAASSNNKKTETVAAA